MGQQHAVLSGGSSHSGRTAVVGSPAAAYAVFDALVFLIVIFTLAVILNPFLVFVSASVVVTIINLACCSWLNHEWSSWIAEGHGKRIETRLARMRGSKVMRHPANWIISGSDAWSRWERC